MVYENQERAFFELIAFGVLFGYNDSGYNDLKFHKGLTMKSIKRCLISSRLAWFAFGFLAAAALMVSSGADQSPVTSAVRTYEIETAGEGVYLLDTRTGQLWLRSVMFYYDLGTPQAPIYKSTQLDR